MSGCPCPARSLRLHGSISARLCYPSCVVSPRTSRAARRTGLSRYRPTDGGVLSIVSRLSSARLALVSPRMPRSRQSPHDLSALHASISAPPSHSPCVVSCSSIVGYVCLPRTVAACLLCVVRYPPRTVAALVVRGYGGIVLRTLWVRIRR